MVNSKMHHTVAPSFSSQHNYPKLTVWLRQDFSPKPEPEWNVERVVLLAGDYQSNVAFSVRKPAQTMLARQVWEAVNPCLPTAPGKSVFSSPDLVIEMPGLYLGGMSLTELVGRDGQRVMLTFKRTVGDIQSIFAPNKAPSMMREIGCNISAKTIGDILLPAINLAVSEPIEAFDGAEQKVKACLEKLKANKLDIEFYLALIERYVAAQHRDLPQMSERTYPAEVLAPGEEPRDAFGIFAT